MDRPNPPEFLLGVQIKHLNHAFARRFIELARQQNGDEISMMHGRILSLLYHHRGENICQKDIEDAFHITRSSVTGLVKRMEERGYILRRSVEGDARLKKLVLTSQGEELYHRCIRIIDETETQAVQGLTQEELETFCALAKRICSNLSNKEGSQGLNH